MRRTSPGSPSHSSATLSRRAPLACRSTQLWLRFNLPPVNHLAEPISPSRSEEHTSELQSLPTRRSSDPPQQRDLVPPRAVGVPVHAVVAQVQLAAGKPLGRAHFAIQIGRAHV